MLRAILFGATCIVGASSASAETQLSFYGGYQAAPHSSVSGTYPGGGTYDFVAAWEGRSFDPPPYYGVRATFWKNERFGWGVDFNHAKVYADDDTLASSDFTALEFTDGLNIVTVNGYRRWKDDSRKWTPYVGAGVGLAVPHVDVEHAGGTTFGYQITGPAITLLGGVQYDFNERWGVYGEYKGTYSSNSADLDGGGTLQTDILTHSANIGITYSF